MIVARTYNFSIVESTKSLFCKNWILKYSEDVRNLAAKKIRTKDKAKETDSKCWRIKNKQEREKIHSETPPLQIAKT